MIVKNKNIQALMMKNNNLFDHLVAVYCDSETIILLHRNNICFFGCRTIIKIYWIHIKINATVIIIYLIHI